MNKKQWMTLSIVFYVLMFLFIGQDFIWNNSCQNEWATGLGQPATAVDVSICVKAEVYAPFVWLFFALGVAFSICSSLEPKKKN